MMVPVATLLVLLGQAQSTPQKPKAKLAVFDVQPLSGVTRELAQSVSAVLVVEVRKRATEYSVIGADEIRSLLSAERMRQQLGCAQGACLAEIGGALGASRIVTAQLSKLGSVFVLTVKLIDSRHGTVERDASAQISSDDQAALLTGVGRVASRLFLTELTAPDDSSQDLFTDSVTATAESRSHVPSFLLGGLAVVGIGFAVAGLAVVQSYNVNVGTWNNAYKSGQPLKVSGGAIQDATSQANTWTIIGFAGLGVAALSGGGAVLVW